MMKHRPRTIYAAARQLRNKLLLKCGPATVEARLQLQGDVSPCVIRMELHDAKPAALYQRSACLVCAKSSQRPPKARTEGLRIGMKRITILIADDHRIVRDGLRKLLQLEKDLTILGEAGNGREAIALVRKFQPDVVIMDIAMPVLNGLAATQQILIDFPQIKVLMLSGNSEDAYVAQARSLGASGFLAKHIEANLLAEAVRAAYAGKPFFSSQRTTRAKARRTKDQHTAMPLTAREITMLQNFAILKSDSEVADLLQVKLATVQRHRKALMAKLALSDQQAMTRYALDAGLISSSGQVTIL